MLIIIIIEETKEDIVVKSVGIKHLLVKIITISQVGVN